MEKIELRKKSMETLLSKDNVSHLGWIHCLSLPMTEYLCDTLQEDEEREPKVIKCQCHFSQ